MRLIAGNAFWQCGQVFNQNTNAVGFPNSVDNDSVPLPVRLSPAAVGGGEPISERAVAEDAPGA